MKDCLEFFDVEYLEPLLSELENNGVVLTSIDCYRDVTHYILNPSCHEESKAVSGIKIKFLFKTNYCDELIVDCGLKVKSNILSRFEEVFSKELSGSLI